MKFFKSLIKKKLSLGKILVLVFIIISIRIVTDYALLDYPIELNIFQEYTRFFLENLYYFSVVFLLLTFFISKLIRKGFLEVANFSIRIFPIIIIPSIIDHFVFKRTLGYEYATLKNFIYNFFTISWIRGDASTGISIEISLALILIGSYVYYWRKSILRAAVSIILSALFIVIISTPEIFFGLRADYYYLEFLPFFYYFPLMIITSVILYNLNPEKLKAILSNIRPMRSLIYVLFVILGSLAALRLGANIEILRTFLASISLFFIWQFSVVINDIYDFEIDKISNKNRPLTSKKLSVNEYRIVAYVFFLFAVSFSIILNFTIFASAIFGLILAFIYSAPPIRLRKYLFGNLAIGLSLVISFAMGIFSTGDIDLIFNDKIFLFSIIIFILGSIITLIKDIKDLKGDKKHGIKNIFSLFGKQKGKIIVTTLLFFALNLPGLILKDILILPVTFIFSLFTCYIYYKKEKIKLIYIMSMLLAAFIFVKLFYF